MSLYYITDTNWITLLGSLVRLNAVYGLVPENDVLFWKKLTVESASAITINRYRAAAPAKSFYFPVKEEVTGKPPAHKTVIVGAKACDLGHLKTTDALFLGGPVEDPYYAARRKNTFIISADCNAFLSSCFCTKMGGAPYPVQGFDINLSPTRSGFLAETGSEAAEALVATHKKLFQNARPEHVEERKHLRENMTRLVEENNASFSWQSPRDIIQKAARSPKWDKEIAAPCVECDACRFACGTCYCFLLSETAVRWEKLRTWDSCQSTGYARVAGGANPRKTRGERLKNLYQCKMVYRPENFGVYACTGCGRCIDVCQGRIDIRKSLQKLDDEQREGA